jgi:hypothetical protein
MQHTECASMKLCKGFTPRRSLGLLLKGKVIPWRDSGLQGVTVLVEENTWQRDSEKLTYIPVIVVYHEQ